LEEQEPQGVRQCPDPASTTLIHGQRPLHALAQPPPQETAPSARGSLVCERV
jgi:hypothetical protein